MGVNGIEETKMHIWLKDYNWRALIKKELPAPFVPTKGKDNFDLKIRVNNSSDQNESNDIKVHKKEDYKDYFKEYYYLSKDDLTVVNNIKP